ncbi:MAG: alpha/beta hydrolase [archaeon]|nr:alpha/beta hydrolase [archaeon]
MSNSKNHSKDKKKHKNGISHEELIEKSRDIHPHLNRIRTNKRCDGTKFGAFITSDGYELSYRDWSIKDRRKKIRKIIICIHGLHSHGEKFILLADKFIKHNWNTYALDLRGHGLSWSDTQNFGSHDFGDITDYKLWIRDTIEFIEFLRKKHPDVPIYLLGDSMGGAVAIHVVKEKGVNLSGLVLLSPALKAFTSVEVGIIKNAFFTLSNRDALSIQNREHDGISTNSAVYIDYQHTDPLRMRRESPRYYEQILKMLYKLKKVELDNFPPLILFYGEKDQLIDFVGVKDFITRLKRKSKALHYIPSAYHELLTDIEAVRYGLYKKITKFFFDN